jgi:hypothetical protein
LYCRHMNLNELLKTHPLLHEARQRYKVELDS